MVRFYLDTIEVVSPDNWEDMRLRLLRDRDNNTLLFSSDTTFTFSMDGARYLKQRIDEGFCGTVDIDINDDEAPVLSLLQGTIFLSSCEIDEGSGTIKAKVEDRSFYKSINSNKQVEALLNSGKSKNQTDIDPCDSCQIAVHVHTSVADVKTIHTVRVHEAFRYLVEFMSNGALSFVSDTFDMGGDWEGLVITSGLKLRGTIAGPPGYAGPDPQLPPLSFLNLYTEVKKKIPIGITVDNGNTIRIEAATYFEDSTVSAASFDNIERILTSFDQDRLYSSVRVGSTSTEEAGGFPETQNAIGFKEEQYISSVECNIDRELNLVSEFIISSNVINDCVDNNATSYDDNWFFITCILSDAVTGASTRDDIFATGDYFYNDQLRNINVLQRQLGGVPDSLIQFYGDQDPSFKAIQTTTLDNSRTVNGTGTTPAYTPGASNITGVTFDAESGYLDAFDTNGVYDSTLVFSGTKYNVFTAPADALYGFEVFANFSNSAVLSGSPSGASTGGNSFRLIGASGAPVMRGDVEYRLYDAAGVLLEQHTANVMSRKFDKLWSSSGTTGGYQTTVFYPNGNGYTQSQPFTFSYYMQAGWHIVITPVGTFGNYQVQATGTGAFGTLELNEEILLGPDSYFRCYSSSLQDLEIEVQEITDFVIRKHSFSVPMTQTQFEYLKANSTKRVPFSMFEQDARMGWIDEISYSYAKGTAEVKLSTNYR